MAKVKKVPFLRRKINLFVAPLAVVFGIILLAIIASAFTDKNALAGTGSIDIRNPKSYQVIQRDNSNRANIVIRGAYSGNPSAIQARWRGGPWTTIVSKPASNGYGGILMNQPAGQGRLEVRFANLPGVTTGINYVGIGDIFVMAGQSNMGGRGVATHFYTPTNGIRAGLFGNDDNWKELTDPYDSPTNYVDYISNRGDEAKGSFVALFTNKYLAKNNVPVAFIPVAIGGSTIERWSRSTSSSTLYGSMLRRVKAVGGNIKAVLWFQGENNSNTSVADYEAALNTLANNIAADFHGAPTIPAIIGSAPYAGTHRAGARIGTINAVYSNPNLLMGPAFYDVNIDDEGSSDGLHFSSNDDLIKVSLRFWYAVDKALYGASNGYGPELVSATYLSGENTIQLKFKDDAAPALGPSTAKSGAFYVTNSGVRIAVSAVTYVNGDTVNLKLASTPNTASSILVSLGHDNRSGINNAIYDSQGLPAVPFMNARVTIL